MQDDSTIYDDLGGAIVRTAEVANSLRTEPSERARLTLIAHSFGCKFLAEALVGLARSSLRPNGIDAGPYIAHVIFASPAEVPSDALISLISKATSVVENFTIYCSHADQALAWRYFGGLLADRPVAGADRVALAQLVAEFGLQGLVDVIETSPVANFAHGLRGHSDYATSAIDDLRMHQWIAPRAAMRGQLLHRIDDNGGAHYWQMRNLDDRTTRRQRSDPWFLTPKLALRRALEGTRKQGSIEGAIRHNEDALQAARLGGAEGAAKSAHHARLIEVLQSLQGQDHPSEHG